uniref:deoxycytidylate deaminase n=1 Tax=Bradyrhizobium sp. (strain ORS 278) TaxID=114615 RepID=UPI000A031440|nr:deaminase [Bradyrhizobium sp. ORS 278]
MAKRAAFWMDQAAAAATQSKDRSRKIGCVIVDRNDVLVQMGWKGFPRRVNENVEACHVRPLKNKWTEHAERNAIYKAAARGVSTLGCTIYLSWFPCSDCARAIIQSGIERLICVASEPDDPQWSEDIRFILMARSDRKRVLWPMPTHARVPASGNLSLFGDMKPWRPARDIIDWKIKGRSIYDRKKPLAPATLARIHAGAVKFGWPEPFIVTLRNHMAAHGVDQPIPTIAANGTHIGLAEPFLLNRHGDGYGETRAHSIDEPAPTANCDGGGYVVEPLVVNLKGQSTAPKLSRPCRRRQRTPAISISRSRSSSPAMPREPRARSTSRLRPRWPSTRIA